MYIHYLYFFRSKDNYLFEDFHFEEGEMKETVFSGKISRFASRACFEADGHKKRSTAVLQPLLTLNL
ncbi:hypothetical protein, partial [uncultured Bacteroides sp.]|uniref:hypothetical protein n=1 Tax=uncultured Bacteroides sp. TaxID=162156 RepID=UPI0026133D04